MISRAAFLMLGSLLVFFTGCSRRETVVEQGNKTQSLHLGNYSEPRDLDPQLVTAASDVNIVRSLLEGLTELDPQDNHAVPGVATNWEVAPDHLTWTFHLRADSKWSNGDPVTAEDFAYAYRRALSPALGAEYGYLLFTLRNAEAFLAGKITDFSQVGVQAIDAHTLVLHLKEPTPYLPVLLTHPIWFPVHRATIEKFGRMDQRGTAWTKPGNFVGNGAFVLKKWVPNQVVQVTRSPSYWDRDRVKLNEVSFYPIESANTEEAAFRAGQLHVTILNVPVDKIPFYEGDPVRTRSYHASPLLATLYFRFNCDYPALKDMRVRQALSLAIDRMQISERILHTKLAASSLTPPGCAGYEAGTSLPFNVAEAKRLLAEAGYPEGKKFPKLEMLFPHTGSDAMAVLESIQAMWRKNLGIEVSLAPVESKVLSDSMMNHNYQIGVNPWLGDYLDPTTFLDLMRKDSGNNQTGWSNPRYDALLNQAVTAPDQAARYHLFQQAETILMSEMPVLPIYYYVHRELRVPSVHGWHDNLLDMHPLKFVSLEN